KLYHRISKETVTDVSRRSSRKVRYRDSSLFDWVQVNIVEPLNRDFPYHFFLIRNDLEVIKYEKGDFFVRHQDHVNCGSNEFVNYTFLLNLRGCEKGGETLLYPDLEKEIVFECTGQEPGSLLIFPKEMDHAGKKVEAGTKLVLMGNLICYPAKPAPQLIIGLTNGELLSIPVDLLKKIPNSIYYSFV